MNCQGKFAYREIKSQCELLGFAIVHVVIQKCDFN